MRVATLAIALALTIPVCAEAGKGGGRGGHSGSRHHAHHFHGGARVFIGTGVYYGWPYYYPYYNPADVLLYPPPPTDPYWYYCRAASAYYPYVKSCPGGWERYLPGTPQG